MEELKISKVLEVIKFILSEIKDKDKLGLKNYTNVLYEKIKKFSIENEKLFVELLEKKFEKVSGLALMKIGNLNTKSLMIDGLILFIRQFDKCYS